MKFTFAALVFLVIGFNAGAVDIQTVFEELKDKPVDYEPTGQVCEQVARLQFGEQYDSSQYEINVGVEYKVQNRTIGELDLVITDKKDRQVVLVGEVKCWKDMNGALNKARNQRNRFIRTLQSQGSAIVFDPKEGGDFESSQFSDTKYVSISQAGGTGFGFDDDLDFSLKELMGLRSKLLACQSSGECARPE